MIRNQKIVENRTKHPRMLENVRYTLSQVAIITGINISTIHRRVGRRDFLIEDCNCNVHKSYCFDDLYEKVCNVFPS